MRQNGTNGVTPTRRIVLGGGLSAVLWRLGARGRAEVAAPAAQGVLDFEAAPARLQLAPAAAEPAAAYAYAGAIPGPLIRLRQGEELRLKLTNKLIEPTTLSFPGLRAANAAAGIGGLTQDRLRPGATAEIRLVPPDSGFNLYLPHAGSTDASQQGRACSARLSWTSPRRRMPTSTQRWCCPSGTSTRAARSRTILLTLPSAGEAGAEAMSFSPIARPRR
jgi:hypothetical protein